MMWLWGYVSSPTETLTHNHTFTNLRARSAVCEGVVGRRHEMLLQKSKLFTVIPGTNLLHGYHG